MNDNAVHSEMQELRREADAYSKRLPPVDVDSLLLRAGGPDAEAQAELPTEPSSGTRFSILTRLATAAAIVVAVTGVLSLLLVDPFAHDQEPPGHLTALVDSLYSDESYVIDEIARYWSKPAGPDYMDGVWDEVVTGIGGSED
jgi:hypothetical protein